MSIQAVQVLIADSQVRGRIEWLLQAMGEIISTGVSPDSKALAIITDKAELETQAPVISIHSQAAVHSNVVFTCEEPFLVTELSHGLANCSHYRQQQAFDWNPASQKSLQFPDLVGKNPAIMQMREMMGKVATKDVTVLVTGESGTGKEIIARSLHAASFRCDGPFIPVNCGAIPDELLESELFGHEKGAFTGAVNRKPGRFELAEGGTLFLDEIGELPLHMQVKLLRALQDKSFERVGGTETKTANVRIIVATHRDLEAMIKAGEFREDLYYRLNVFPLQVPPLRERCDDVVELVARLTPTNGAKFDAEALAVLTSYSWPGNVRELSNLLERMAIQQPNQWVGVSDLPERFRRSGTIISQQTIHAQANSGEPVPALLPVNGIDLKEYLSALEKGLIQQALDDTNDVVARAADRLHVRRTTLVEKMRKYGMQRP